MTCGVRYCGCTFAAHCGSRPSRAIAKKMRGCPYWNTSSTAVSETTAPSATIQPTVVQPGELQRLRQRIGRPLSCWYGTSPVSNDADDT